MDYTYYDKFINKNTKIRYDVTPIFRNPKVFSNLITDLIKLFKDKKYNIIAGIDALGFIIGSAMAFKTGKGFVPVRKGGKFPCYKKDIIISKFFDYSKSQKSLELNKSLIKKSDKVLIVDEWIETGSQIKAAIKLIEKMGGKIIGIVALNAEKTSKTKILFDKYDCRAINLLKNK